jgi:hypothetical protein
MANEQKVNKVKGNKINFYKFVGKIADKKGVFTSIGDSKVAKAVNNLGSAVNGIARVLDEFVELSAKNFLASSKQGAKYGKLQKGDEKKKGGVKNNNLLTGFGKIAAAGFGGILGLFGSLFSAFVILPIFDWIRKNPDKVKSIVEGVAAVGKFLYEMISGAVYVTLELIAGFTKLPFWKEILKFGMFFAALGVSFLAFKKLFGGKAATVVVKTIFKLFKGFFAELVKFSVRLAKRVAKGARGALKKGGLGRGRRMLVGAAAMVGTGIALDAGIDALTGKQLEEAERELTAAEKTEEEDTKKSAADFEKSLVSAIASTEQKAKSPAAAAATPSPVGGVQPAVESKQTTVGGVQPAPETPTRGVGGILPGSAPVPMNLPPPSGGPPAPMSKGGRVRSPILRALGGAVSHGGVQPAGASRPIQTPSFSGAAPGGLTKPIPKFKPLGDLSKLLGTGIGGSNNTPLADGGDADAKKQQRLLPKLIQMPLKAVGVATLGILNNLIQSIGRIPGAGIFANVLKSMIDPVASAFGLKSNVGQMAKSATSGSSSKENEQRQKKEKEKQAKNRVKVLSREQQNNIATTGSGGGSGKKDRGFFGNMMGLIGMSKGGWIQGPQTGYPVSLDGGNSVSFIGHGTEYVATKSQGGKSSSAYVVPYDTPATRGNKNLTDRRIGEAMSAGYKFSSGGTPPQSVGGVQPAQPALTPMQQWAGHFPDLAAKVKPGQSGYDEIRAVLDKKPSGFELAAKGVDLVKDAGNVVKGLDPAQAIAATTGVLGASNPTVRQAFTGPSLMPKGSNVGGGDDRPSNMKFLDKNPFATAVRGEGKKFAAGGPAPVAAPAGAPAGAPAAGIHPYLTKMDDKNMKKSVSGPGLCVTGSLDTMQKSGVPNPAATGSDRGNNPRGAIVQLIKSFGWRSIGGSSKQLNSPYGQVSTGMYSKGEYSKAIDAGLIPSGALIFQTKHPDWNGTSFNSRGYDMAIARKKGNALWNGDPSGEYGRWVYGGGTQHVIALSPGGKSGDGTAPPAGGGGGGGGAEGGGAPGSSPADPNNPNGGAAAPPPDAASLMQAVIAAIGPARDAIAGLSIGGIVRIPKFAAGGKVPGGDTQVAGASPPAAGASALAALKPALDDAIASLSGAPTSLKSASEAAIAAKNSKAQTTQQSAAATTVATAKAVTKSNEVMPAHLNTSGGGGAGGVTVPVGGDKKIDDVHKFRPGFGHFSGATFGDFV